MQLRGVIATAAVVASCGGMIDPQSVGNGASAAQAGDADAIEDASAPPASTGIPRGPARAPGAVGTRPCKPLDQPSQINPTKLTTTPMIVGHTANSTVCVVDSDPQRPGQHRAFIGHGQVLERHAVSDDSTTAGTFIIDRGMPNQIVITSTSLRGAGADGVLLPVPDELMAVYTAVANDAPESLAYAPAGDHLYDGNMLFVVGPVANGVLGVPRVFYGPSTAIKERAFLGFGPSDSYETASAAVSVTFDLDGTPTTMSTIVQRETQPDQWFPHPRPALRLLLDATRPLDELITLRLRGAGGHGDARSERIRGVVREDLPIPTSITLRRDVRHERATYTLQCVSRLLGPNDHGLLEAGRARRYLGRETKRNCPLRGSFSFPCIPSSSPGSTCTSSAR